MGIPGKLKPLNLSKPSKRSRHNSLPPDATDFLVGRRPGIQLLVDGYVCAVSKVCVRSGLGFMAQRSGVIVLVIRGLGL